MNKASFARIALIGAAVFGSIIGSVGLVNAQTLDSTLCNKLYGLPTGTIATSISLEYLNPTVCAAMNDLISRYNPGPDSSIGLTNAKVQGITSLNSTFAVNLDNMLKAAGAAGYYITINSAYRTQAGEVAANSAAAAKGFVSMHTLGQAADLQYPNDRNVTGECDYSYTTTSAAYQWVQQNDKTYNIALYGQAYPPPAKHVYGECNHVQAISGSTDGTMGPGNPNGSGVPVTPQIPLNNNISNMPGLGAPPTPGQIVTQNTQCQLSNGSVIIVPAGSTYPYGCINNGGIMSNNGMQASCIGNSIGYNLGGTMTTGQICPAGCFNGACIPTTCPAGSMLMGGVCSQQQCGTGYMSQNGFCNQTQMQQQTAAQPAYTAAAPASSAAAPASTASAPSSSGTTATNGGSTAGSPAAPVTLPSPTLLPNLGTSTLGVLQTMANPQASATPAAPNPITLNSGAQQISELQANAPPGVTYAEPTSDFFPANGQSGTGASGSGTNNSNNGITTTSGTGYSLSSGTGSGNTAAGPAAAPGTVAYIQPQSGVNTFTSSDLGGTAAPASFTSAPNTFVSDTLSILAGLKSEVLGALGFLASYVHPFGGNVPSQSGGE